MKKFLAKWAVVCALALGASACQVEPEPGDATLPEEQTGQQEAPVFNQNQQESIRFRVRPIIYPVNFTQATPLTDAQIRAPGGLAESVEAAVNAHIAKLKLASNNMLDPYFVGPVEINRRNLAATDFIQVTDSKGNVFDQLKGAVADTMLASDFGGVHPAIAVLVWGPGNVAAWTYGSGFMTIPSTIFNEGFINHESMHMLERHFQRVPQTISGYVERMVDADALAIDTTTGQSAYTCITTAAARKSSTPGTPGYYEPDFLTEELLENILTLDDRCNGSTFNWCVLYKGAGKFGTFSSDLCNDPNTYWLSPGVAHSWIRNASMVDANWLYTEWDLAAGANTFNVKLELLNGSGTVAATVQRNSITGASDRGNFRYQYFHRGDLCPALQSAGAPAGTYTVRVRVDPTTDTRMGHRKVATGTLTCGYKVDTGSVYNLAGHGGTGGTAGTVSCGAGYVAVGLIGRYGPYVNRLGLACAWLSSDGSLGTAYDFGTLGGTGGTYFADLCPSGQMLVGVKGRSYSWHDQISGECANVKTWATTGVVNSTLPARGGTGGIAYTERCPAGYSVGLFNMRAGIYVDYLQARCYRTSMQ
jgi:hypothetical protein